MHATALVPVILAYAHFEAVAQAQQMATAAEGIIEQLAGLEQDVALELAALDHQRGHLLNSVWACVQHASFGAQLGAGPDDPDHFHQRLCRVRWQPSFTARAQRKASRCSRAFSVTDLALQLLGVVQPHDGCHRGHGHGALRLVHSAGNDAAL